MKPHLIFKTYDVREDGRYPPMISVMWSDIYLNDIDYNWCGMDIMFVGMGPYFGHIEISDPQTFIETIMGGFYGMSTFISNLTSDKTFSEIAQELEEMSEASER